jgi:alpha-L-arabinofuranosidase
MTAASSMGQSPTVIKVDAGKSLATVQPTMWGIFFEDINLGADGGLYAELVKNRSFEFRKPLMGWTVKQEKVAEGSVLVQNREVTNLSNPRYIQVKATNANKQNFGIVNEGFRGMGIKKGLRYDFSLTYRQPQAGIKLNIELVNNKNEVIGEASLVPTVWGNEWNKQSVSFYSNDSASKAKLNIWFEGNGRIDLDMVSLFPGDTWKKRPGGMRADMVQLLADMKPGFLRFPGGCVVEGYNLSERYQWKKTIGALDERQLIVNRWNFEFAHRSTPDYFQTFGLGFFEYFELAEDMGAEPLPILNCGMACQFNSAEVVPLDQLDPYVQDALDLIEFANGDTTTYWGNKRAKLGHPRPFNLKLLGVGNENWGPQYLERLQVFTRAIKNKYPEIKLVNSSGTDPNGDRFDLLNNELRKANADIIDEHYYRKPEWFLQNASRYDNYDRNGPKIFAGEYAAQSDRTASAGNKNNWRTALAEAAFMTGLERNAGVVSMASYAPLFAHVDGWQWTPDMIWVDNLRSMGTPNYYVQKLYSTNKGADVIAALSNNLPLTGQDSLYASAVIDKKTKEIIIKLVNVARDEKQTEILIDGIAKLAGNGTITVLAGESPDAVNSLDAPLAVQPTTKTLQVKTKKLKTQLQPGSFTVIRLPYN